MIFELSKDLQFPPAHLAEPRGLLAIGGDLSVDRLTLAYRSGIFPWYTDGQPILWFSPDPRLVLFPDQLKVPNSLRRIIKSGKFTATWDKAFGQVIKTCKEIHRPCQDGTWITNDMESAYIALHEAGHAHSVEVWQNGELVGGLYGVIVDKCFCGESMFTRVSNAGKVGFVWLVQKLVASGFRMIDCQMPTELLKRFGAIEIPRRLFLRMLGAGRTRQCSGEHVR